jgi:hypothetical protein
MDCLISISNTVTVLQLVLCNFNHDMSQSHNIDLLGIASIELIIMNTNDTMWTAISYHLINFKCVLTLDVPRQS